MDQNHFARLTGILSAIPSRRDVLRSLAAAGLGLGVARFPRDAEAKQRRQGKPKKPKRNAFGCVDVGKFCKNDDQCCSGICTGKKDRKQCRAHNAGTCTAADDACAVDPEIACGLNGDGVCFRTTGKASFCGAEGGECRACARDVECEAEFGPGASCVVCVECDEVDTACVAASA